MRRLAAVVAVLLLGAGGARAGEDRADFVLADGVEPRTLDPQLATGMSEARILAALFEGLVIPDPETLEPMPGAAESWQVAEDGRRWTFRIRPGARWSNGDAVTAHDFVYAWTRLQEPATASEYAYLYHFVRHARAFNEYAASLRAIRGDPEASDAAERDGILGGLVELARRHPGGIPAGEWRTLVERRGLRTALAGTPDPTVREALGRAAGVLSPEEVSTLVKALLSEAGRRRAALGSARAHFGKDEGVFAPDDRTFVVELEAFTPYFLEVASFHPVLPVHRATVERRPEGWWRPGRIVSNGPFRLEDWQPGERIRLRKDPGYWASDQVHLETIDVLPIQDRADVFARYEAGEIDWVPNGYPPERIHEVRTRPDFYSVSGMITYYYRLNVTRPALDDARVRRALGLAIDRRGVVEEVLRAGPSPATAFVSPGIPGYESPPSALGYDPVLARRLLAEAGFPEGRGFRRISILFNSDRGHLRIAEHVAAGWRDTLGIEVDLHEQDWQAYQHALYAGDYDVARSGWIGDYRDPNTFLDMWVTGGGNNQTGWGDPRYDRLIELAADPFEMLDLGASRTPFLHTLKEREEAEVRLYRFASAVTAPERVVHAAAMRLHLLREAEAILLQDAFPILPIYHYAVSGLLSPRVEGFHTVLRTRDGTLPNVQDIHPLRSLRMRPAGPR